MIQVFKRAVFICCSSVNARATKFLYKKNLRMSRDVENCIGTNEAEPTENLTWYVY